MAREKYYFEVEGEEYCYNLDYFKDRINDGETEIKLKLAKRDYGSGYMWCQEIGESIESGDGTCGTVCKDYKPRNGKSGRCRSLENAFDTVGKTLILTKDGLTEMKDA